MEKKKEPKKLFLTDEEHRNIKSRQSLLAEHNFYLHLLNNAIVDYLKQVVYPRLGLDTTKDYALDNDSKCILIEEDNGK